LFFLLFISVCNSQSVLDPAPDPADSTSDTTSNSTFMDLSDALPSQQYANSTDLFTIPGCEDLLGFGYDARYSELDDALKKPLVAFTFDEATTYFYPTDSTRIWKVPDQVEIRTINRQTSEVKLLETIDSYKQFLAINVGIDGYENSTTSTCIVTTNNGTICSPQNLAAGAKLFQFGAHLDYLQSQVQNGTKWITENTQQIVMYSATLKQNIFVLPSVQVDMQNLELSMMEKNAQVYFNFFNTYGTHFIASALMGGNIRLTSIVEKDFTTNSDDLNITATLSISSQEATRMTTQTFQSTLNGHIEFGWETVKTNKTFAQSNDWDISGGDVTQVNFLNPAISSSQLNAWKNTLPSNPIASTTRLEPIENLFDDPFVRAQIAAARAVFLAYDTDNIVALLNSDITKKKRR